jgi:hypothetical protein
MRTECSKVPHIAQFHAAEAAAQEKSCEQLPEGVQDIDEPSRDSVSLIPAYAQANTELMRLQEVSLKSLKFEIRHLQEESESCLGTLQYEFQTLCGHLILSCTMDDCMQITTRPRADYIDTVQKGAIKPRMRAMVVDWLIDVADDFRMVTETLYLTVAHFDRCGKSQSMINPAPHSRSCAAYKTQAGWA